MRNATEPIPEPSSSSGGNNQACSICGSCKSSSSLMDLSKNKVMQRRLNRDWKLPADIIKTTLQNICVECVCKLNMHSEVTRTLMQRLHRLTVPAKENESSSNLLRVIHSPPIADAEVSTTGVPLPQDDDTAARTESRTSAISDSSCSGLRPYSAQPPESPSATESGGLRNISGNAVDGWKWRTRLVCQNCERAYFRKDHYNLHLRRCCRQDTRDRESRTERPSKCRVLNEASNDNDGNNSIKSDNGDDAMNQAPHHSRTFQCKDCEKEFAGIVALRQHERTTHRSKHCCSLCDASFGTKYEWELHHTICSAKHEAMETQETADRPRSTRLRSRPGSVVCYNYAEATDDESDVQLYDDDDATSMADTMYTRRMNFTGDWIVSHSRSNSNSAINLSKMYDDHVLEESQITTHKEYDLYLLDLLKAQVQMNAFTCFVPSCRYKTDTLVNLMKHDYMQHWKMSWFYCQKCGDVFTSKVFLDYHLHRQNRGVYICHKCHDEFELQHQLDRHQVLHNKGINYHCNYCRLEFLSEAKLLAHCEHEQHNPNDEPPLIRIDRSLSICNPVAKEPPIEREYLVHHLHIPQTDFTRHGDQVQHKPLRLAIGICEFDNRNPPNCVGCS